MVPVVTGVTGSPIFPLYEKLMFSSNYSPGLGVKLAG
jgi:hypothetical protein